LTKLLSWVAYLLELEAEYLSSVYDGSYLI